MDSCTHGRILLYPEEEETSCEAQPVLGKWLNHTGSACSYCLPSPPEACQERGAAICPQLQQAQQPSAGRILQQHLGIRLRLPNVSSWALAVGSSETFLSWKPCLLCFRLTAWRFPPTNNSASCIHPAAVGAMNCEAASEKNKFLYLFLNLPPGNFRVWAKTWFAYFVRNNNNF